MQLDTPISSQLIEAIIASREPVLRNLQITQTYSDINAALRQWLGGKNVSWCAYATWASKTAGQFIRQDTVEHAIAGFLQEKDWIADILSALPGALTWFGWKVKINDSFIIQTLNETAREASRQVAEGNLLVFAELAPLYEQFLRLVSGAVADQPAALEAFLAGLRGAAEDKEKLVRAFTCYHRAIFEKNEKARAELIFLANVLVGLHEQIRLDRAINNSMNAPVEQIFRKTLLGKLDRWIEGTMPAFLSSLLSPYVKYRITPVVDRMADRWRTFSTERFMRIEVPGGHLDLSEDVPMAPYRPRHMFPDELAVIENEELKEVLAQLDLTPDSLTGSGAKDWGKLSDRMNFIADFFRSAQQDEALFRPPFTPEQTLAIRSGRAPAGKL